MPLKVFSAVCATRSTRFPNFAEISYALLTYAHLRFSCPAMLSLLASQTGLEFCAKPQSLKGQVDGDGHSLRKIYVSNGQNQEAWLPQFEDARQRWKKQHGNKTLPKYWLGHVRVAGSSREMASP